MPNRRNLRRKLVHTQLDLLTLETEKLQTRITAQEAKLQEFDNLIKDVAQKNTVFTSAVTLIKGLADHLSQIAAQAGDSPTADQIIELQTKLDAAVDPLAQAVAQNTPAQGTDPTKQV